MIEIKFNGETRTAEEGTSLRKFLTDSGIMAERCAASVNGKIIRSDLHVTTTLNDGDNLEIMVFVGGG
ncbi:MAG: sulfur carrier protein ThiS [Fibrobacterota bacterium]